MALCCQVTNQCGHRSFSSFGLTALCKICSWCIKRPNILSSGSRHFCHSVTNREYNIQNGVKCYKCVFNLFVLSPIYDINIRWCLILNPYHTTSSTWMLRVLYSCFGEKSTHIIRLSRISTEKQLRMHSKTTHFTKAESSHFRLRIMVWNNSDLVIVNKFRSSTTRNLLHGERIICYLIIIIVFGLID